MALKPDKPWRWELNNSLPLNTSWGLHNSYTLLNNHRICSAKLLAWLNNLEIFSKRFKSFLVWLEAVWNDSSGWLGTHWGPYRLNWEGQNHYQSLYLSALIPSYTTTLYYSAIAILVPDRLHYIAFTLKTVLFIVTYSKYSVKSLTKVV